MFRALAFLAVFGVGYFAGGEMLRHGMAEAFTKGEGAALCAELQRGQ